MGHTLLKSYHYLIFFISLDFFFYYEDDNVKWKS